MSDNKLISIIIPVKNGEKYLAEAIDGIKKQGLDTEIIVVNDGSTDGTVKIAEQKSVRVINHEICRGQVVAKNTGLKVAQGKYILFHDADDVMRDGVLKKMYETLEGDSTISAVMMQVQDFISPELSKEDIGNCVIQSNPYFGLFTGAVLIRKSVFDVIGFFTENINTGEIIEWKHRMDGHNFVVRKIEGVATNRRVHTSNYGRTNKEKEFKDYLSVLRKKLRQQK